MKKTLANIRTLAALLIASATIAACSNDDGIVDNAQPAQQQAPQMYTLTLQAGKADNAQTRALDLDGTKLVAKWAAGEQVTVTRGTASLGTLSVKEGSVSADGQTCTFTGTLTGNIATDDVLTLTYHPVASTDYSSQTGTLESAAACDMATASVTVTAVDDGTNTITAGTAEFETQTAVLKITMLDAGGNKINATELQVSAAIGSTATNIFSFSPTDATYTANGNGILYFALPSAATVAMAKGMTTEELAALPITFSAKVGDDNYTATKTGYPFAAGKYYETTLNMAKVPVTNLSTLPDGGYEAQDGETLTGTLTNNVMIGIADGATVTLKDVNITNLGDDCDWAGITCAGDATLVLEGTNEVCAGRDDGGYNNYPGICIAPGKTLTIQGDGTLTAYSNASYPSGAGIGGGFDKACGNIVINSGNITATGGEGAAGIGGREASCGNITINGGTITATGGQYAAGIGGGIDGDCGTITINGGNITATGGQYAAGIGTGYTDGAAISCGNITISGGTVTATGGQFAAGIGSGNNGGGGASHGNITITSGVTSVTAKKGSGAPNSIGAGDSGADITVNIGGNVGAITTSPYTYQP